MTSLSKHQTKKYDAISEANNLKREQVVRQLAAEGLVALGRPKPQPEDRPGKRHVH
ncbi:MAG: hypothetical protein OXF07_03675 [Rhodobacter sp.]|nr:hypothetical protein [Rhodobacter sp.]MCY4169581.1 hypothetical protein [Rhodobacter sp.]MCY4242270.1 hypothetical protein [Rhodobacter sp.]